MADRYRPKPTVQRAREGNPSKTAIKEGVIVPRVILAEPDWNEVFKASSDPAVELANVRCREVASEEWRRVVPVLEIAAGIGEVDHATVKDLRVCVARIDQAERDLSGRGLMVTAERGTVKNGAATIAAQYRTQLARYIRELGLYRVPELQSPHPISTKPSRTCGTDFPRGKFARLIGSLHRKPYPSVRGIRAFLAVILTKFYIRQGGHVMPSG